MFLWFSVIYERFHVLQLPETLQRKKCKVMVKTSKVYQWRLRPLRNLFLENDIIIYYFVYYVMFGFLTVVWLI